MRVWLRELAAMKELALLRLFEAVSLLLVFVAVLIVTYAFGANT
jgi:hypothetical protein